jgi:hypothetical protein
LDQGVLTSSKSIYHELKWSLLPIFRAQRMDRFFKIMRPQPGAKILDVGGLPALNGVPSLWNDHTMTYKITLLNLPGSFDGFSASELARYELIEADACNCQLSQSYDLVFSNALIEHVGNFQRQKLLAKFILSAANNHWVQTPSPLFPLEAHCDVPFWWFLTLSQRKRMISEWYRGENPFTARQMASTRPIWASRLRQLFPDSQLTVEYFLGFPKSQIVYRRRNDVG